MVFGGWNGSYGPEGERGGKNDTWVFSLEKSAWEMCQVETEKPPPRRAHSQFTMSNSSIIVYGGLSNRAWDDQMWLLDLGEKRWTHVNIGNVACAPRQTWRHSVIMKNRHMCVVDRTNGLKDPKLYVLDCSDVLASGKCEWLELEGEVDESRSAYCYLSSAPVALCGGNEILVFCGDGELGGPLQITCVTWV